METVMWVVGIFVVVVLSPVLVYFVVKYGTMGYLEARKRHRKNRYQRKGKQHGDQTTA